MLRLVVSSAETADYDALVEQGLQAEREGNRSEARELFHKALRLLPADRARETSALMRWIGRTYQTDGDPATALECLEVALAIAEANSDFASKGHAINLQAIVHWQSGKVDEAERLYNIARETALTAGDVKLAAMTAQNLGIIANIRGDVDLALRHFETGLSDYRALGLPADVCKALNNLGLLHTSQQRWAASAAAFEEALQIAEVLGDISSRIMVEVNYAEHFIAQGNFARARAVADLAAELALRANDSSAEGELEKVFGVIARETGDLAASEEHLTRAQSIAGKRNDLLLLAETTKAKADLHRKQGRNRDTLQCLNVAHRLFSQLRAQSELADIDSRVTQLESDFLDVVRKWSESIESKDHYTQGHCERVADLAGALAARAGLDAQSLFWFRIGAMLHDVGKLVISSEVLNKSGPLSPLEWELMKQHPLHGVEMLADIEFPWDVRPIVESHHERWDGKGYPHGLSGEDIPLTARILCIADVYDALTSERSYKRSLSHQEAIDVMRLEVGKQFDPALFSSFEEVSAGLIRRRASTRLPVSRPHLDGVGGGAGSDELTGLPLRRAFLEFARGALQQRAARTALLVIDVDHFKLVNDTFGHLSGDAVLREVAQVLRRHLRPGDFLGRYAGDEFVALLPDTAPEEAVRIADELRRAAHGLTMGGDRGSSMCTTISIGVALAPDHGGTVEELFTAADAALYDAKLHGRDVVVRAGMRDSVEREPVLRVDRFVGRAAEHRRLTQQLDESLHDGARIVAVVGEAGVGKSALVRELASDVRMRAGSLVLGRCIDADARAPLAPWTAVLQAIRVLRVVADRPWRQLDRLLSDAAAVSPAPVDGNRFELFEEVAEYLRLAAAARPLVIVLDDMQWADETTWDLLEHVLSRVDRDRILFSIALREEDNTPGIAAHRARISRDERFTELRLARMTQAEQRDWLHHVLRHPVDSSLAAFVFAQSEGNPFFAVQTLRALLDDRRLRWADTRWEWDTAAEARVPLAVRDLLSRRVGRLSPQAHRILTAAAVLGRAVDVELAVRAGIGTEPEILDAIDEGIADSVLEVSDVHGEHHISFSHALLVEIMRESLNPGRRRRLHQRIADALEELRPTSVAALAHHYDLAAIPEKAYTYARLAAEHAASVYAYNEAIELLAAAERHTLDPAARARVRLRRAAIAENMGRYREAEEAHRSTMTELSRGLTDALRAESGRALVRLRSLQGDSVESTRAQCRELLAQAEALGLGAERAALLMTLSQSHSRTGDNAVAEVLARQCLALAEGLDDRRLLAEALLRVGSAILQDRPAEAMAYYTRAYHLYASIDDTLGQIRCQINLGVGNTYLGGLDAAEAAYRLALARGREIHTPDVAGLAALNLGALLMKRGRIPDARAHLEEAHMLFQQVSNEPHRIAAIYNLAHLAREERRIEDATRLYREAAELARPIGLHEVSVGAMAGIGLMALDDEAIGVARAAWQAVVNGLGQLDDVWFQGREMVEAFAVRMSLAEGETERAQRQFEHGVELGSAHDAYGAAWLVATCAAAIAALSPSARARIEDVAAECARRVDTMGSPPLAARFASLLDDVRRSSSGGDGTREALVS